MMSRTLCPLWLPTLSLLSVPPTPVDPIGRAAEENNRFSISPLGLLGEELGMVSGHSSHPRCRARSPPRAIIGTHTSPAVRVGLSPGWLFGEAHALPRLSCVGLFMAAVEQPTGPASVGSFDRSGCSGKGSPERLASHPPHDSR